MQTAVGGRVEDRVGYALKRAQHALRSRMDRALHDLGLTTAQYAALSALETAPGLSGAELARRSFVTPQTMNGIVTNLEAAGLLRRRPQPNHGRVLEASLSAAGAAVLAEAHGRVAAVEARMVASLNDAERRHLLVALRACAEALIGPEGELAAEDVRRGTE